MGSNLRITTNFIANKSDIWFNFMFYYFFCYQNQMILKILNIKKKIARTIFRFLAHQFLT